MKLALHVLLAAAWCAVLIGALQEGLDRLKRWRRPAPPTTTTVPEPASALGPTFDPRARLFDWAADCPHLTDNQKEPTSP